MKLLEFSRIWLRIAPVIADGTGSLNSTLGPL